MALPSNGLHHAVLALQPCCSRASPGGHLAHCRLSHDASNNSFRFLQFHYQALWEPNGKKNQLVCWPEKQLCPNSVPSMKTLTCCPAVSQARAVTLPEHSDNHTAWSYVEHSVYPRRQTPPSTLCPSPYPMTPLDCSTVSQPRGSGLAQQETGSAQQPVTSCGIF